MKKGLLLIVVMVAAIAVKAQDIYVGGSFNVWRNSTGNTTSFKVAPEIGYNFNESHIPHASASLPADWKNLPHG